MDPLECTSAAGDSHDDSDNSSRLSTIDCSASTSSASPSRSQQSEYIDDYDSRCPYVLGFATTAIHYEPPDPFVISDRVSERTIDTDAKSHAERCFSHAPLSGRIIPDLFMDLTVTSVIRTGFNTGPQLVVVNDSLVAKIFDPLYYNQSHGSNVLANADYAYRVEAAAYAHLQKFPEVLGLVPKFHGTWTIEIPQAHVKNVSPASASRSVCLILIEHLHGPCMLDVDTRSLSEHVRSTILKQCIDAETRLFHTGIIHRDFFPRNIVLLGSDYDTPNIQVKVIDFGSSELLAHPSYRDQDFAQRILQFFRRHTPKLSNPIKRWFGGLEGFNSSGWCPEDPYEANKWLWDMFGNDEQYITVSWDKNDRRALPRYVNEEGETDDSDFDSDSESDRAGLDTNLR